MLNLQGMAGGTIAVSPPRADDVSSTRGQNGQGAAKYRYGLSMPTILYALNNTPLRWMNGILVMTVIMLAWWVTLCFTVPRVDLCM